MGDILSLILLLFVIAIVFWVVDFLTGGLLSSALQYVIAVLHMAGVIVFIAILVIILVIAIVCSII